MRGNSVKVILLKPSALYLISEILIFYFHYVDLLKVSSFHEDNTTVKSPYTPHLCSKTGVYSGIPIFLILGPKHRFWVPVRTASGSRFQTCTHNRCYEQTY